MNFEKIQTSPNSEKLTIGHTTYVALKMELTDNNGNAVPAVMEVPESKNEDFACAKAAALQLIEELTCKCDEVQGKVLAEILSQNVETEYLKRILPECTDRETFKSKVPVITYEDIKPEIQRIANGDFSPIICARPISELFLSSATSGGEPKMIPTTDDDIQRRHNLHLLVKPVMSKYIEGLDKGKTLCFLVTRKEMETPGGLLLHPVSNAVFKGHRFQDRRTDPHNVYTTPMESIHCPDQLQAIYIQLLCGFYQRHEVTCIAAQFASKMAWVIQFLQRNYFDLCHDISSGELNAKITDPTLRARMAETFMQRPQPELAEFVSNACIGENWEGIIKKIWPNTLYLEMILTGSFAQYIPILNHYSGGLPLVSNRYTASESAFGINLNPMCDPYQVSYTIMPNMAYFEFLPIDYSGSDSSDGSQSQPVDMANVEVGREYELMVTTYTGLYRYRVMDVLCPTGFYNKTPQFKFVRRLNMILKIDTDMTTEDDLQRAVTSACSGVLQPHNAIVAEYTSHADFKTVPPHYVIYWELLSLANGTEVGPEVLEQCCSAMEASLSLPYKASRRRESVGALEIRVVKNGTFEKLRDYAVSKGASREHLKVPRCVKLMPMLELLDAEVVSSNFSTSLPLS